MGQPCTCEGSMYVGFLSGTDTDLTFQHFICGNNCAILDTRQAFIKILETD